jgi:V/A-type H+-transporting ATPase subunit E
MANPPSQPQISSGIELLIQRLKDEGVAEGEAKAEKVVSDAEAKASEILAKADKEAKRRTDAAAQEAEQLKRGGEEALKIAMRDAVLQLKEGIASRFAKRFSGLVADVSADADIVRKMILAVAARTRDGADLDEANSIEIILPRSVASLDDVNKNPDLLGADDELGKLVRGGAADLLRDGVSFSSARDDGGGITVVLKDKGVQVDLTDKAVAAVLLSHLQPRFRALLEDAES